MMKQEDAPAKSLMLFSQSARNQSPLQVACENGGTVAFHLSKVPLDFTCYLAGIYPHRGKTRLGSHRCNVWVTTFDFGPRLALPIVKMEKHVPVTSYDVRHSIESICTNQPTNQPFQRNHTEYYSYIVTLDGCDFYNMQSNESDIKSILVQLFSLSDARGGSHTLRFPTCYSALLRELRINAQSSMVGEYANITWVVENVRDVLVYLKEGGLSIDEGATTRELNSTAVSEWEDMSISLNAGSQLGLKEAIANAPGAIRLKIKCSAYESDELDSLVQLISSNYHVKDIERIIKLEGDCGEIAWFDTLRSLVACSRAADIDFALIFNSRYTPNIFELERKVEIIDVIEYNESLMAIHLKQGFDVLDKHFVNNEIESIFRRRHLQKQVLAIVPTLESHDASAGLLGKLLRDPRVCDTPSTLFDFITVYIPFMKYQWDSGLHGRAVKLKRVMERNARDWESIQYKIKSQDAVR